jgi:hypothetical protein
MKLRHGISVVIMILWSNFVAAAESWVLFGSARASTTNCAPTYIWATETVFHNTSSADRQIVVLHQSKAEILPPSIVVRGGESLPLSSFVGDFPPGLAALKLDVPADVVVESRLEYRNILPCSGQPPALGPSGKLALPSFRLVNTGQPQRHFGLDLGIQSIRVNVGVYNAAPTFALATIEMRRPACDDRMTSVVMIPPDTLIQTTVPAPLCAAVLNPRTPYWMVNATVTVDQPSFSYATTVSNVQQPNVTFGVGIPDVP